MIWIRIASIILAALVLPDLAQGQTGQDDPEIAAAEQAVFDAPFAEKDVPSEKLLKLIGARFGEDSAEYATQLQLHSANLGFASKPVPAQRAAEQAVTIISRLSGENSTEAAFAKRRYAQTLSINGFKEEAAAPYSDFVRIMTDAVFECGRSNGMVFQGCNHDEDSLGGFVLGYATLLNDNGAPETGIAAFDTVLARFEPRWAACGTDAWGFDCAEAATKRRAIQSNYARYLEIIDQTDAALAMRGDVLFPQLEALTGCEDRACEADWRTLSAYNSYRSLLTEMGREDEVFRLGSKWLPVLASAPAYAAGKTATARSRQKTYTKNLDFELGIFAEAASASGQSAGAREILASIGMESLFDAQLGEQASEARLAELTAQIRAISFGEEGYYERRAPLLRQRAEVTSALYGATSDQHVQELLEAGISLARSDQPALAEQYMRQAFDASVTEHGLDDFRSWNSASYLANFLVQQARTDEAIVHLGEVLADPGNNKLAIYTDPLARQALSRGFTDPHRQLNALHSLHARLLMDRNTSSIPGSRGNSLAAVQSARHAALGALAYRQALGFSYLDEQQLKFEQNADPLYSGRADYRASFITLADALVAGGSEVPDRSREAFLALQEATMGTTSRAVARSAAQKAAGREGASALLEERAAIDEKLAQLDSVGSEASGRERGTQLDMMARLRFRRAGIDQELAEAVPGYFELVRPQALDLEQAQALLGDDEAVLFAVPSKRGTHMLLLTATSAETIQSSLREDELNFHVRRLLWDLGADIDVTEDEDLRWSAEGKGAFPFDRGTAHLLYRELLAPLAEGLSGKQHLFVVSDGALSSLPFGVLVTEPPQGQDGDAQALRDTQWLADQLAIVQLPSLQSLQLLRAVGGMSRMDAGERLVGFGDPVLAGYSAQRGSSPQQRRTRAGSDQIDASWTSTPSGTQRLASTAGLRTLSSLPGTRTELLAMSAAFGEDRSRIFLGEDATETTFRAADLRGASVLSFATHGLLGRDLKGLGEPSLVFTPPLNPSDSDDGLLTSSEVAALELTADWVILSACNTASGDGSRGASGLSGLARSFFFAGAESLLASHWPVDDAVAAIMTVRLIELQRENPGWSRAEALQAAMREIREDRRSDGTGETWAHPNRWAPFAYIGDIRE